MKMLCGAIYAAGLLAQALPLTAATAHFLAGFAMFVVFAHIMVTLVFWRVVSRYQGPLMQSLALGILFGSLHVLEIYMHERSREALAPGIFK